MVSDVAVSDSRISQVYRFIEKMSRGIPGWIDVDYDLSRDTIIVACWDSDIYGDKVAYCMDFHHRLNKAVNNLDIDVNTTIRVYVNKKYAVEPLRADETFVVLDELLKLYITEDSDYMLDDNKLAGLVYTLDKDLFNNEVGLDTRKIDYDIVRAFRQLLVGAVYDQQSY